MTNDPKKEFSARAPTLEFTDDAETTVLARRSVELVAGDLKLPGKAEIKLDLVPVPGLYIYGVFDDPCSNREYVDITFNRTSVSHFILITYEAQLPAAGGRWQGFRRLRDDLSGRIDRRFALSNDPPTAIDHHVRPQAELRT